MRADSRVPAAPSARRRVVLVDVDGTLVTYTGALPDSAADAVRRARAAGHRVYPTTGRSKAEMPGWFDELGLDGMIGANGSYIESDGEVVAHRRMEPMDVATVVDWLTRRDLPFYLEANSGLYAFPGFREDALPAVRAYAAGKGRDDAETVSVDEALHGLVETADLARDDVNKISYVLSGAADLVTDDVEADGGRATSPGGGARRPPGHQSRSALAAARGREDLPRVNTSIQGRRSKRAEPGAHPAAYKAGPAHRAGSGRYWDRTSDLFRVREARSRCANRPRWVPDSNRCKRLCRPVPNLSANPP